MALNLSALLGKKKQTSTQTPQKSSFSIGGLPQATISAPTSPFPKISPAETIRSGQRAIEKLNLTSLTRKSQVRFPFAREKTTTISQSDPLTRLAFRLPELPPLIVTNGLNFLKKNINAIVQGKDVSTTPVQSILGIDTRRFGADVETELRPTVVEMFKQALEEERLNPSEGNKVKETTNALKAVSKTLIPDVLDALFAVDISKGIVKLVEGAVKISARQLPDSLLFKISEENISPNAIYDVLIGGEAKATAKEVQIAKEFINKLPASERAELFRIARSYETVGLRVPIQGEAKQTLLGKLAGKEAQTAGKLPVRISGLLTGKVRPAGQAGFLDIEALGEEIVSLAKSAKSVQEFKQVLSKEQIAIIVAKGITEEVVFNIVKTPVIQEAEIKRVGKNILKNNLGITQRDAEAMAKDVIRNREFNQSQIPKELQPLAESDLTTSIQKAKASGLSFDEWVKGQPIVYHGSPTPLKSFSDKKGGVFFTDEYADATGFAGSPDNVYEGFLNFKKPLIIDAKGAKWDELNTKYGKSTQEVISNAQKDGYDGVVFKNIIDNIADDVGAGSPVNIYYAYKPKDSFVNRSQLKAEWDGVTSEAEAKVAPVQKSQEQVTGTLETGAFQTTSVNITTKKGISKVNEAVDNVPPSEKVKTTEQDWRGSFELPPETKVQAFRRSVEDFNVRLKVLNDKIEEVAGNKIDEHFNLWAQKDMLPRKQSDILRRLREEKQNFVRRLVEADIKVQDLDEYLHARHAIERNAKMNELRAEKGLEPKEGLSGMTDKKAKEILAKNNSQFEPFEKEIRTKIKETLEFEVSEGLIKAEDAKTISQAYENYFPLYRDIGEDVIGIGSGIDIRGKEIKRAKGSEKRVTSVLGNVFFQAERAQIRALKNGIGNTIIELTETYPFTKDLFEIEAQKFIPRFNAEGELQYLDPKFKLGDNVLGTKKDGKQYFITVKDPKTARALKNLNIARIPTALKFFRSGLAIWSSFKTRLRPEFLVTNFQRDLGEALVNLGVEKTFLAEKGKGLRIAVVKDLFPSQRQIWKYLRGKQDASIDEFFKLGGDAGHFWLESANDAEVSLLELQKQIQNIGKEKIKNTGRSAMQLVDDINSMVELGVRYSTYKQLIARGMSKEKAIQAVADLTLNFSRQGELSPVLKSLYGFINPAIQGTSKVVRTIGTKQGRARVLRAISYLVALGFITRIVSMMIDDEGDEQISDWTKNHKVAFSIGNGKTITLWSMPYGYTSFYSFGSNIAEVLFGKKTIGEATGNVFDTSVNAFSPFGTSINDITPTLVKPIFDINANKAWYDGPVHPDQVFTDTPKPNYEVYFNSTSESAKFVAEWVNILTGGGNGKSGLLDFKPNDLEYLYDQFFGGPFEFVTSSIEAGALGVEGEFDPNKTPFVRQVFRENQEQAWAYGIIYDTLERAYKKDLSKLEIDRFYRAIETGLQEEIFEEKRANEFIQKFVKAQYQISGSITSDETVSQLEDIPKSELEKLISTYATSTQKTINNKLGEVTQKKTLLDILGGKKKTLLEKLQ